MIDFLLRASICLCFCLYLFFRHNGTVEQRPGLGFCRVRPRTAALLHFLRLRHYDCTMDANTTAAGADNKEVTPDNGDDDFSASDEYYWEDTVADTSVVVGYAFGPKKMSTMGIVMAEASRTRLTTTTRAPNTKNNDIHSSSLLTTDALQQHTSSEQEQFTATPRQVEIIFDVRKIVRHFHSNRSSVADSTTTSTGTRTASTTTALSQPQQGMTTATTTTMMTPYYSSSSCSHHKVLPVRVSFVPLDPNVPIENQHGGRIDVILHKLTEDILLCSQQDQQQDCNNNREQEQQRGRTRCSNIQEQEEGRDRNDGGNPNETTSAAAALDRVQRLCDFSAKHACPLVDDPRHVQRLMSRAKIAETLQVALQGVTSTTGRTVAAPKYAVLPYIDKDKNNVPDTTTTVLPPGLTFPLIVKPLTAAGTKASHRMAVVLKQEGLQQVTTPCLGQAYVNHNAWLYKVYVLGEFCSVHKRRSLPNLPTTATATTTKSFVAFDSQRPYPRLRDFGYNVDSATNTTATTVPGGNTFLSDGNNNNNSSTHHSNHTTVTAEEVQPVVQALKQAFGIELFGFDILVSADDDALLVVDVNYFPSYKEVPNFAALLAKFLTDKALEGRGGSGSGSGSGSETTATTERTSGAATSCTQASATNFSGVAVTGGKSEQEQDNNK